VYLVAEGAERFAHDLGLPLCANGELVIEREVERLRAAQTRAANARPMEYSEHDTVGAVALDSYGNLAAGTSTGGTLNKTPGRVGDSSLIGCGCYADNESAAVSTTGWGEPIMKLVLAKWAADRVEKGATPDATARMAVDRLEKRLDGHGGIILLDRRGRYGIAHNTRRMAWALSNAEGQASGISAP
jgi:beta-aspartyl-peptidase (threonine type)